jgi:hypothetical protein
MKAISVILPSRGRGNQFRDVCARLFDTAANANEIEVICRIDDNDPSIPDYLHSFRSFPAGRMALIVGPQLEGYASNAIFIEEAYRLSTGALVIQFNDDAWMETKNWDEEYLRRNLGQVCVMSAHVEPANHTRFSFPCVNRETLELTGRFCLDGNPSVDRCWESFAEAMNCEIRVPVQIRHDQIRHTLQCDDTARASKGFYRDLEANWGERSAVHRMIGQRYADQVKRELAIRRRNPEVL